MKKYTIRDTGLQLSRLSLGCMGMGREKVRHLVGPAIETAIECGINLIDHADIYCKGESEKVFGEYLGTHPGIRDQLILQSKCGIRQGQFDFSKSYILQSVEGILQRLQIEQLDILLLHRPDCLFEPEEVASAFDSLHDTGKVRYFGVSNFSSGQISLLQAAVDQPLLFNQLQLSLLHSQLVEEGILVNQEPRGMIADGLLDFCRLQDVRVQAWSPLDRGALISPAQGAEKRVLETATRVEQLAEEYGCSAEAIVLAWLLRHPAAVQPVIGTVTPDRIRACCQADSIDLTREQWYELFVSARGQRLP